MGTWTVTPSDGVTIDSNRNIIIFPRNETYRAKKYRVDYVDGSTKCHKDIVIPGLECKNSIVTGTADTFIGTASCTGGSYTVDGYITYTEYIYKVSEDGTQCNQVSVETNTVHETGTVTIPARVVKVPYTFVGTVETAHGSIPYEITQSAADDYCSEHAPTDCYGSTDNRADCISGYWLEHPALIQYQGVSADHWDSILNDDVSFGNYPGLTGSIPVVGNDGWTYTNTSDGGWCTLKWIPTSTFGTYPTDGYGAIDIIVSENTTSSCRRAEITLYTNHYSLQIGPHAGQSTCRKFKFIVLQAASGKEWKGDVGTTKAHSYWEMYSDGTYPECGHNQNPDPCKLP